MGRQRRRRFRAHAFGEQFVDDADRILQAVDDLYHLGSGIQERVSDGRLHSQLGGCLSSYHIDDYWIEQFYHHCFAGDRHLLALLSDLNLSDRLEWLRGTTGYFVQDTIYPLNTPLEILAYPHLSLPEKVKLALLILRSRNMDPADLDTITAKDFIVGELGERVYDSFFEPLRPPETRAGTGTLSWRLHVGTSS